MDGEVHIVCSRERFYSSVLRISHSSAEDNIRMKFNYAPSYATLEDVLMDKEKEECST